MINGQPHKLTGSVQNSIREVVAQEVAPLLGRMEEQKQELIQKVQLARDADAASIAAVRTASGLVTTHSVT